MTQFCTNCGAAIPDGAKFCPQCGRPASPPAPPPVVAAATPPPAMTTPATTTPATTTPARSRVGLFAGVAVTLVILGIAVWALLTGMPFANEKKLPRTQQPAPPVVSEQEPGGTSTTSQIRYPADDEQTPGAGRGTEVIATTTTAPPSQAASPPVSAVTAPAAAQQPAPAQTVASVRTPAPAQTVAPVRTPAPAPQPQPTAQTQRTAPVRNASHPASASQTARAEISESQAEDILRSYIVSRDYYQAGADCVGVASQGYKNRGYTIDVVDRCGPRGRLGRWRVDTLTREIFVEKADGRYLRP